MRGGENVRAGGLGRVAIRFVSRDPSVGRPEAAAARTPRGDDRATGLDRARDTHRSEDLASRADRAGGDDDDFAPRARQVRARLRERAQETQVEVAFAQQTGRPDLDHDHLVLPRRLAHAHIAGTHPGRLIIVHLGVHRSRGGRDDALLRLRRGTRRVLVTATMAVDISAGARAPSPVVRELGSEIPRARERSNWRIKSPPMARGTRRRGCRRHRDEFHGL